MNEPYTYTLPEQFLKDPSVPARWRVWAVINGFFIGGQYCWASNEWLADKIGAHKDTVSQAVSELETLGIIRCERGARSRSIYPMIGANAYQWSAPTPISDRRQRLSISDSISDNKTSADALEIVEVSEKEKSPRTSAKYPNARTVFREVFGEKYPRAWDTNTTQLVAAENLYTEHGIEESRDAYKWYKRNKPRDFALEINTPYDLDNKFPKIEAYFNKIKS